MTDFRPQHAESLPFPHLTGYWVNRLGAAFRTEVDRELRDFDLTRRQVGMLIQIDSAGSPSASDLTRALSVDSTAVTRMLDRLEEKALIFREPDPDDGRRMLVRISPAARRLLPKLQQTARKVESLFEADVPEGDLATFHRVMMQMLQNVDQAHFAMPHED